MDDLEVEIVGENGAIDKDILCNYRMMFSADCDITREFSEHQEVEVFSQPLDKEPGSWRKAIIKMIRGELYAVEYVGCENTDTQIVRLKHIRHINSNPTIDRNTFFKFEIDVPEDLREHSKLENSHEGFKNSIKAAICRYSADERKLIVISRCARSQKLATMMKDMHFRNLGMKILLSIRTEESARLLKSAEELNVGGFYEEFQVPEEVIIFFKATGRLSIELVKSLQGITYVELDEALRTLKIRGETDESIKKARRILEYSRESIQVPRHLTNEFLGENDNIIFFL